MTKNYSLRQLGTPCTPSVQSSEGSVRIEMVIKTEQTHVVPAIRKPTQLSAANNPGSWEATDVGTELMDKVQTNHSAYWIIAQL